MRVALVGKFNYWALLTPSWEKYFQVLEVRRGMKLTQDLSYEEKAILASFFVL